MSAEHLAFFVAGAHVQMGIVFSVHGGNGTGEGDDFKIAGEGIGVILFPVGFEHTHGEFVHRAQAPDAGQFDVFLQCQNFQLLQNLLAPVQTGENRISKAFVFHFVFLLWCKYTIG